VREVYQLQPGVSIVFVEAAKKIMKEADAELESYRQF